MNQHHTAHPPKKKFHRDWRFIVVVLMLIAMVVYVFTLDEAIAPGRPPANESSAMP